MPTNNFFMMNETLTNFTLYFTGSHLLSGIILLAFLWIILEIIEAPIAVKTAFTIIAVYALLGLVGLPPIIAGIVLVIGGLLYYTFLRNSFE